MKKLLATITLIVAMMSAFANDEKTIPEIQKAFTSKFTTATEVSYVTASNYSKVLFQYNGNWMTAFYSKSAELIGVTRNIRTNELPFYLAQTLKNEYQEFWIIDLFEFSDTHGFKYYATVQNANKTIVLVSSNGTSWQKK